MFAMGCVQRCCPGCSGSRLLLGGVRVLWRVLLRVLSRVLCSAVQGAPDHVCDWAVSGCCPGCCARDKGSKAEPEFNVLISIWGLCWCNCVRVLGCAWCLSNIAQTEIVIKYSVGILCYKSL